MQITLRRVCRSKTAQQGTGVWLQWPALWMLDFPKAVYLQSWKQACARRHRARSPRSCNHTAGSVFEDHCHFQSVPCSTPYAADLVHPAGTLAAPSPEVDGIKHRHLTCCRGRQRHTPTVRAVLKVICGNSSNLPLQPKPCCRVWPASFAW